MHFDVTLLAAMHCDAPPLADKQREAALLTGVKHALSLPAAMHFDATPLASVHYDATLLAAMHCDAIPLASVRVMK